MTSSLTPEQRFWAKVEKTETCWLWTAGLDDWQYARLQIGYTSHHAHRLAYQWFVGPIPDGLQVDHICHVRHCVRPGHLQLVANVLNSQNRAGANRNSKSGVRGVHWRPNMQKWHVQVRSMGRTYSGGLHVELEDAELAAIALRNRVMTNNLADRQSA